MSTSPFHVEACFGSRVYIQEDLTEEAMALARRISKQGPVAVRSLVRTLRMGQVPPGFHRLSALPLTSPHFHQTTSFFVSLFASLHRLSLLSRPPFKHSFNRKHNQTLGCTTSASHPVAVKHHPPAPSFPERLLPRITASWMLALGKHHADALHGCVWLLRFLPTAPRMKAWSAHCGVRLMHSLTPTLQLYVRACECFAS